MQRSAGAHWRQSESCRKKGKNAVYYHKGVLDPRCKPVLVPTMLPEDSAADIGVKPSDHRVADLHPGGHLIARFTALEQSMDISLYSTGHVGWGCNYTEWVPYIVEGQGICYFRFSHVIIT